MEKLVKLLIEKDWYDDVEYKIQSDWWYMFWCDGMAYREERICSKKFWFIERLVKNDKINKYKLEQEAMSWFNDESPVYWKDIRTDRLIMMLSVSNSPIKDLIYYLGKEDEDYIKPWWYKLVFNAKKQ